MTAHHRLAILLTAALVAGAPVAPALAQSAGNDQYADPFPTTTTSKGQTTPMPPLQSSPQPSSTPGSAAVAATTKTAAPAATGAAAQGTELPRTGSQTWLLALLGVVLVLTGVGLRKRTADGRRS